MNISARSISQPPPGHGRDKGRLLRRSALAVAVALSVAGMTAVARITPTLPDASPLMMEQSAIQAPPSFAALVEHVQAAVVNVAVTGKSVSSSAAELPGLELPDDPRFKDFFDRFFQQSPARAPSESPKMTYGNSRSVSIFSSARSVLGSRPRTCAGRRSPLFSTTWISVASSTT